MQAVLFCWELQLMHVTLWPSPTKQHWERSTKAHGLELGQVPWQDTLLVRPTKKSNQVNTDDFISVTQQSQLLRSFDMVCCIFSAHWWRFCGRSSREAAWIHKTLSTLQAKFVQCRSIAPNGQVPKNSKFHQHFCQLAWYLVLLSGYWYQALFFVIVKCMGWYQ